MRKSKGRGDARRASLDRLYDLVKRYPGIEQRQICRLMGCSLNYAKALADDLIHDRSIERKLNHTGAAALYPVGYLADLTQKVRMPKQQWNDCRNYQVPLRDVLTYCNLSIPVPEEFRSDIEPSATVEVG